VTSCSPDIAFAQRRPAHALARDALDAARRRVQWIAQSPITGKQAFVTPARGFGVAQIGAVDPFDHVEEEKKAQLLGIG
jgi:hypothetical protein